MDMMQLADMWKFPWPVLDVLIGGKSSIDMQDVRVPSFDEATAFLKAYGYDPEDPRDQRRMHGVLIEAMALIERKLLTPREWNRGIRPPDEILFCDDPRHLLVFASGQGPTDRLKSAWACAVLRVMHTIAHIEGVNRTIDVSTAREQIFARFHDHIFRDKERRLWLGDDESKVELSHVEWKEYKNRNSIILKLLHKRDNVAETIFDFIGVRLVTKRLCDVMMVVKYLRQFNMVVYPNAYPSRARNNLIDVERFKTQLETLRDMLTAGSIKPEEFETMVGRLTAAVPQESVTPTNPHSAATYRSIQLTGRQLIKMRNPEFGWLDKLKRAIDAPKMGASTSKVLGELRYLVDGWHAVKPNQDLEAFFPFEVQILDQESHAQAMIGDANHDRYKTSQVRAARKRVLSRVLELSKA